MIVETFVGATEIRTAQYSECGLYRYSLEIVWSDGLSMMACIGLNPSTATHLDDDPTLRRVKGFARGFGYGGIRMLNAFALRSTDPANLFKHKDPIGPENTVAFLKSMSLTTTIAAWGGNIQSKKWKHFYRGHDICNEIVDMQCLKITHDGHPSHPLYLKGDLTPIPFNYTH